MAKPNRGRKQPASVRAVHAAEAEFTHEVERAHQSPAQAAAEISTVEHEDGDLNWSRPSSLDAPLPRPGYAQRWVRHQLGGVHDTRNWQRARKEGWNPRGADTVDADYSALKSDVAGFVGVISAEGLILCEMPERMASQRKAHYADATARQLRAVDQDLHRVQSSGGPSIHKDHKSTAEMGRRPVVAGDV